MRPRRGRILVPKALVSTGGKASYSRRLMLPWLWSRLGSEREPAV